MNDVHEEISKRKRRGAIATKAVFGVLITYTLLTLLPFYFLVIRAFVPTVESTTLHVWFPDFQEFDMDSQIGNFATYFNLDLKQFKKDFQIRGFLRPYTSFQQISDQYDIPQEEIISYVRPLVRYNGWYAMLKSSEFYTGIFGTVYVSLMSILLGGVLGIMTGSVLAGLRTRWHRVVYNTYLLSMVIPPIAIMIPVYMIFQSLHFTDSYWNLIIMNIKGEALITMLFTTFIATIPKELKESVEIDGGGRLAYLWKVVFPLCKTPFAVFVSIRLPWFWNDLLNGYLFLKPDKYTLMPFISSFAGSYTTNYQAIFAGLILSMAPLIVVYLLFRNLFVQSALSGAIKG